MTMDEQTCSFSDLMNVLRCKYGGSLESDRYKLFAIAGLEPRLEGLIVKEWFQGIPPFMALNVPRYLDHIRLPCEMLKTLFHDIQVTMEENASQEERWLRICLAMTPPFQTQKLDLLRDMRPDYKHRAGIAWRGHDGPRSGNGLLNRHMLITILADALWDYEVDVQRWRSISHDLVTQIQAGITVIHHIPSLWKTLRKRERLPAALKRIRKKKVEDTCTFMNTLLEAFGSQSEALLLQWHQGCISHYYDRLLITMNARFKRYGPDEHYGADVRHHALSAILSSLLIFSEIPLDVDCTTPAAIQQRLRRFKKSF